MYNKLVWSPFLALIFVLVICVLRYHQDRFFYKLVWYVIFPTLAKQPLFVEQFMLLPTKGILANWFCTGVEIDRIFSVLIPMLILLIILILSLQQFFHKFPTVEVFSLSTQTYFNKMATQLITVRWPMANCVAYSILVLLYLQKEHMNSTPCNHLWKDKSIRFQ